MNGSQRGPHQEKYEKGILNMHAFQLHTYVQRLANQNYNKIPPVPSGTIIPVQYRNGLDHPEFVRALSQYQELLKTIYNDIAHDPESFGMISLPIDFEYHGPVSKDEGKSRKSFARFGNTLHALFTSCLIQDGKLIIDEDDFKSYKIPKSDIIKARLLDYGFVFQDSSILYPDNPHILRVMKAFTDVEIKHGGDNMIDACLATADWRTFLFETIPYDLDDVLRNILLETDKRLVTIIDQKLTSIGFKRQVINTGLWTVKYFYKNERKETVVFHVERDDSFSMNIRPLHVAEYSNRFNALSEHVRYACLHGRDCCHCGYCNHFYTFQYEDKSYEKCQIICCNFCFYDIEEQDIDSILYLLDLELRYKLNG